MTAEEAQTLIHHIEASLARAEARLTSMVNERNTRVIDATTAIVGGLHEEIQAAAEALSALSENVAARRSALDRRLDQVDAQIAALAERVPGGVDAIAAVGPAEPPLRELVTAHWRATRVALIVFGALILALEVAQWVYIARAVPGG